VPGSYRVESDQGHSLFFTAHLSDESNPLEGGAPQLLSNTVDSFRITPTLWQASTTTRADYFCIDGNNISPLGMATLDEAS
jgi:hypothetical protein